VRSITGFARLTGFLDLLFLYIFIHDRPFPDVIPEIQQIRELRESRESRDDRWAKIDGENLPGRALTCGFVAAKNCRVDFLSGSIAMPARGRQARGREHDGRDVPEP
jgi:hypothetical protein